MDNLTTRFLNNLNMEHIRKIAFAYNHVVKLRSISKLKKAELIHELQKYLYLHPGNHRLLVRENLKTVRKI